MTKKPLVVAPSSSIPAQFVVEELTDAENLVRFASFQRWLDGAEPYMVEGRVERSLAALEILPETLKLERSVTGSRIVALIARGVDVTLGMEIGIRYTEFRVSAATQKAAEDVAAEINRRAEKLDTNDRVPVRVWRFARNGLYDERMLNSPAWDEIEANYPDKVGQSLSELMAMPRPETKSPRLILWSGEPGTGKTTALRALTRCWQSWCAVQYVSDPERLFNEPAYLNDVLDESAREPKGPTLNSASTAESVWRLIVAEDSDEFLRANARSKSGAALGRVLNLTDGILGQHHEVFVLLTTNEEVTRLHPALIRPGRCLSNIEFTRFSVPQARKWLDGAAKVSKPSTLAELLALRGEIKGSGATPEPSLPIGAYL